MDCKTTRCFVAAVALLLATNQARANPQYSDIDAVTAGGPISLQGSATFNASSNQWTLSLDAVNSSSQSFSDVLFLDNFLFDETSNPDVAFLFHNDTDIWSTPSHSWQLLNPTNTLLMSDTNVPLSELRNGATASLLSTDSSPYIDVGEVGPFATVPFTEIIGVDSKYAWNVGGSFVSLNSATSVPEPSTLVLLGIGAAGAIILIGKRRRIAAI